MSLPNQLLLRLADNETILLGVRNLMTDAVKAGHQIAPAGEWMLDNFYLIEEEIRTAKLHLDKGYSRELPHLLKGPSAGLPRVYDIALETISHNDGKIDLESLSGFIASYQTVTILKLGELWAIPIMLRMALIENLRRIAVRLAADRINRNLADSWADRIAEIAVNDPKSLIISIADMARSNPPMVSSFVAEFTCRLQNRNTALVMPLTWIEQQLSESGLTIEQLVRSENHQQAADQVSMSNSIGSLRFMGAMDWREFVETMSVVEQTLGEDPNDAYLRMDFTTRDRYRHVVERIAKKSPFSESEIARKAIELASEQYNLKGSDERKTHVGFYLIDEGLEQLEQMAEMNLTSADVFLKITRRFPLFFYGGTIILMTTFFSWYLMVKSYDEALPSWSFWLIGVFLILSTSHLAVAIMNWIVTLIATPHPIPRMDFSKGIPNEFRTLVVVPTMITSSQNIEDLIVALEVRFLSNRDDSLHFALLTDFRDAMEETLPEDELLLKDAKHRIEKLNEKYKIEGCDTFFLFHRPRRWNPNDKIWMGYERKRGKLADLNWLLRGGSNSDFSGQFSTEGSISGFNKRFSLVVGNTWLLSNVKYVITLDTDTQLVRDSAWQFVGAMAHPLNRAVYDEKKQRVVSGYGILQPRVGVSLSSANLSRYARMCSSEPGIDPYTRAVSDVYQDIFDEGSFIGKGIYDVDTFELTMNGRFPDNRILSHDLLEGCYARSGLISDVELYEEYPSGYIADMRRRHRWIRGDWQIARWLLPKGIDSLETLETQTRKISLSMLSRWKIFDNLRRSLTASGLTILLLLGWTVLPSVWFWTNAVFAIILIPSLSASVVKVFKKTIDITFEQHFASIAYSAYQQFIGSVLTLICLPYEAFFSLDAIVRTIWRLMITHKLLLQWNPSGDTNHNGRTDLAGTCLTMWSAPAIAVISAIIIAILRPSALYVAVPILGLWFVSPVIAWWISLPISRSESKLTTEQTIFLHRISRKTWSFFETFVCKEDNWLPPDNYQEHPVAVIAHRTSPTNIGLALLANLSAYDFGYISAGQLIKRTANTFRTMESLERYKGHFYNWYDTQSLKPLSPQYISSVDSGNLAGHLMTLRPGLIEILDQKIMGERLFEGLKDTLMILTDALSTAQSKCVKTTPTKVKDIKITLTKIKDIKSTLTKSKDIKTETPQPIVAQEIELLDTLAQLKQDFDSVISSPPMTLKALRLYLEQLATSVAVLSSNVDFLLNVKSSPKCADSISNVNNLTSEDAASTNTSEDTLNINSASHISWWANSFYRQCEDALDELTILAPWTDTLSSHDSLQEFCDLNGFSNLNGTFDFNAVPTLRELAALKVKSAENRVADIKKLVLQCNTFAQMEYEFLFDKMRHLLAIGYNVTESRRDSSYYDLLASEARFASFVAIAQGKVPQDSWFTLGRLLTTAGGEPILLSWSGSMFEYLMPLLVMPTYQNTLLDQTCRAVVARQIEYGKKRGVPWGISECGYNAIDANLNYQYRAFGVPGLGLKRGLADDLVIAPYASVLALMIVPDASCINLERLTAEGFESNYGFYEAIDYTASRLPRGRSHAVVRSFMSHHQGMSLLSLAYLLLDRPMQKRFESEPMFQSTTLLLQERIPKATAFYAHTTEISDQQMNFATTETPIRIFTTPNTPNPAVQLLSNGRYHVMITNSGSGYSRWNDIAVTRWREDSTCDNRGMFCYIRDINSGSFWSTAYQPTLKKSKNFEAVFSEGRAEFRCQHDDINAYTEIVVSSEDDIEVRRTTLTNRSNRFRQIEVTSYAEVVLASQASDALHPAFSNLFVETEIIPLHRAILCSRRPRSEGEHSPWMFHLMAVHGAEVEEVSYETDRMRFIGRGNTVANPSAMKKAKAVNDPKVSNDPKTINDSEAVNNSKNSNASSDSPDSSDMLSGSQGSVFDPIVAIRYLITLLPNESATINMISGIAENRYAALTLVEKYQDRRLADRVFDLSWTHGQVFLRHLNATEADAQLYCSLAGSVIYANASLRADPGIIKKNHRVQSGLWGYAISGDLPIVLVQIEEPDNIDLVRQLMQARTYWRLKGLAVDLVIWNEDHAGYRQILHDQIMALIGTGIEVNLSSPLGGIFVKPSDQIAEDDQILFQAVARVIITDRRGTLAEQINGRVPLETTVPLLVPTRTHRPEQVPTTALPHNNLVFYNGLGGFTPDAREYVITTTHEHLTPAPWVNVLANPFFGTVISESGSTCTWSENAHEFRLTPWGNDPVSDSGGEAFYIRDEESGHFWSPTPLPCRGATPYVTRHGFGYTVFEHTERGIRSEMLIYVALDAAIKFTVIKVWNESGRPQRISITGYIEWVLGDLKSKSTMHIITEVDPNTGAFFARNPYNTEFSERTAFFDVDDNITRTVSGNRTEFIGRNGMLLSPAAMKRTRLSGRTGAAMDPCAAIQVNFDLADGQEKEIVFRLGAGRNIADARNLINRFRGSTAARSALGAVGHHWKQTLGAVNVETPDLALNMMANGWLIYQTIACRLWARNATYQSGGAFGFRDQLQDVMALIHARPHIVREHLILCASRQFIEGDVQHWWHPPTGRGVRTHCSDDFLWLPLATCRYVQATGDIDVLDTPIHFLYGRPLNEGEDSYYDLPVCSEESADLYEHCVRSIKNGSKLGEHRLPLIGSGDWNDGMNLVGEQGKGESVWLGFFLYEVLTRFSEISKKRGDIVFTDYCLKEAAELIPNIEKHGWDGEWYCRAYFDDGSPLGSARNDECQIDSIVQSWSVLSGAGEYNHSRMSMESLDRHLVHRDQGLIQLLDPPFDTSKLEPGYIKGYAPGVRENGAQYTHAAIWAAMAFARLGDNRRAWELFNIINPVNHGRSIEEIGTYKVEPYVVAADVYAAPPHTGRGGWTWYTGSAAWLYRLIVESILGLRLEVDKLFFTPCIPLDWSGFKLNYLYRETVYHISVVQTPERNGSGVDSSTLNREICVTVDGVEQHDKTIHLVDDHKEHSVEVKICTK
ncbi:MAG: cyclic beta 1-2 glucan synthetase [Desulfamplus sp.]|nr:cyclic beta 1-2 glucan synthetase [Desulfamplus sp.]